MVQDGHSLGEQALYEALWDHATPQDKESKLITIGYRQMGQLARLTVNNSKANINSLLQKLAVEEVAAFSHAQGTTYRVFSYPAILERRRQSGLTHYVKRRGVVFVNPETAAPLTDRRRVQGIPFSGVPVIDKGTPDKGIPFFRHIEKGIPESDKKGIPLSDILPYRHLSSNREPSSSLVRVVQVVQEELGVIDDAAVRRILESCYDGAPDAAIEEIEHFIRLQAARIHRSKGVENPIGLLIRQIPKFFVGEAFKQFRQRREQAQSRELDAVDTERYQAVLDDPNAAEQEKRLALAALAKS
ncbi:MAG: hypothetical protein M3Y72_03590 [Acidobacteriota bacterium]|nr:hypothetical protein [Acidobacteriota bacterium]